MIRETNPISKLKNLNLSKYPVNEINSIMKEFGKFGLVVMNLHEGKSITDPQFHSGREICNKILNGEIKV